MACLTKTILLLYALCLFLSFSTSMAGFFQACYMVKIEVHNASIFINETNIGLYMYYEDIIDDDDETICHFYTSEQEELFVDGFIKAARAFAILSVILQFFLFLGWCIQKNEIKSYLKTKKDLSGWLLFPSTFYASDFCRWPSF